jgi:disulfide bond formation protein DsbB
MKQRALATFGFTFILLGLGTAASGVAITPAAAPTAVVVQLAQLPMAESATAHPTPTVTQTATASPAPTVTNSTTSTTVKQTTVMGLRPMLVYIIVGLLVLIVIVAIIGASRSNGGGTSSSSSTSRTTDETR